MIRRSGSWSRVNKCPKWTEKWEKEKQVAQGRVEKNQGKYSRFQSQRNKEGLHGSKSQIRRSQEYLRENERATRRKGKDTSLITKWNCVTQKETTKEGRWEELWKEHKNTKLDY